MNFRIVDSEGFVYGQFPTRILASLALKGMLTFLDNFETFKIESL